MGFYFTRDGHPNMRSMAFTTGALFLIYFNECWFSMSTAKDRSMHPFISPVGKGFSDTVMYWRGIPREEYLKNSIVAIRNPTNPKEILFRRVIATGN